MWITNSMVWQYLCRNGGKFIIETEHKSHSLWNTEEFFHLQNEIQINLIWNLVFTVHPYFSIIQFQLYSTDYLNPIAAATRHESFSSICSNEEAWEWPWVVGTVIFSSVLWPFFVSLLILSSIENHFFSLSRSQFILIFLFSSTFPSRFFNQQFWNHFNFLVVR